MVPNTHAETLANTQVMASDNTSLAERREFDSPFLGFKPITGNFVYCPNQFFDLCLPNFPRGVVRIVGYMLRRTLGFIDSNGEPIAEEFDLPYSELIREAGVGRDAIRQAIDIATQAGFIICIKGPKPNTKSQESQSGCYRLNWAPPADKYTTDPNTFSGFFSGEGNRTPIPNTFFDRLLTRERLAVVKVVGSVIRHTVGYHSKFGRRSEAPISFSYLQRYANVKNRTTLSEAVRHAIAAGYIVCTQRGTVSPTVSKRRPSTYAVKWLNGQHQIVSREDNPPRRSEKRTREPVGKTDQWQSEKRTSDDRKNVLEIRSGKRTKERQLEKNNIKQNGVPPDLLQLLQRQGFDGTTAAKLCTHSSPDQIRRQVEWIDARGPRNSRLGMLRKAIEEEWQEPEQLRKKNAVDAAWCIQEQNRRSDEIAANERKKRRAERKQRLLGLWNKLSNGDRNRYIDAAISETTSEYIAKTLRTKVTAKETAVEFLDAMARDRGLPTVVQVDAKRSESNDAQDS